MIEQSADAIKNLNCINFLRDMGNNNPVKESALTYLIKSRPEKTFHKNLTEGFFEGYTVTFAALQIAYYMGFTQVAIVGMDHRYSYSGKANETCVLKGDDPNHFDKGYFREQTWDNPDLKNSEKYYRIARNVFESDGREILDCTKNGACEVFKKFELEEVIR